MTLEEILQIHFGCRHPMLKTPVQKSEEEGYGYNYLTKSGWRAYNKLISLLYDLDKLCPNSFDVSNLIEELDSIVDDIEY